MNNIHPHSINFVDIICLIWLFIGLGSRPVANFPACWERFYCCYFVHHMNCIIAKSKLLYTRIVFFLMFIEYQGGFSLQKVPARGGRFHVS